MHPQRSLLALAVAGAAVLILPAALPSFGPRQEPGEKHKEDETPLEKQMERIDRGMKTLRRSVTDPAKTADNVVLVRGMEEAALLAVPLCPDPFTPMDETQKTVWRIGFERRILAVADGLLQLEQALVENRLEDAKKQHEALMKLKKDGHNTYIPPEEEE